MYTQVLCVLRGLCARVWLKMDVDCFSLRLVQMTVAMVTTTVAMVAMMTITMEALPSLIHPSNNNDGGDDNNNRITHQHSPIH